MKQEIYYGNLTASNLTYPSSRPISSVTNNTIAFTGFTLRERPWLSKKLDLLFYNRVNEIGEVLSSLVYISNPLDITDVSDKVYDVSKLYINTNAETRMRITQATTDFTFINCKWQSSKYFTSSISPLSDTEHEELAANGNPSVKLEKYGVSFDGWYTQLSVGLSLSSELVVTPVRNLLAMHSFADIGLAPALLKDTGLNVSLDSSWLYLYNPIATNTNGTVNHDGTIAVAGNSLANITVSVSLDNPCMKQELFILPTYIDLYNQYVVQYAEYATYGNPFPTLRDKHRIMHNYAKDNEFLEAQYILQSTEYFRAVTLA
jgi:hypothetical protein